MNPAQKIVQQVIEMRSHYNEGLHDAYNKLASLTRADFVTPLEWVTDENKTLIAERGHFRFVIHTHDPSLLKILALGHLLRGERGDVEHLKVVANQFLAHEINKLAGAV
jgi:hypothetical protein